VKQVTQDAAELCDQWEDPTAIIIILPPGPMSRNSNVDDNNCLLVSSLLHLFYDVLASKRLQISMLRTDDTVRTR
jgi:hypothetical protein